MDINQNPRLGGTPGQFSSKTRPGQVLTHNRLHPKGLSTVSFDSYYFSGANVDLYINNVYIEEAINIQWQLTNNLLPLYGYHSYEFNHMAHGTRIVQGSLTINYKEPLHILNLLRKASSTNISLGSSDNDLRKQKGVAPGTMTNNPLSASTEDVFRAVSDKSGKGYNREALDSFMTTNKDKFWGTQSSLSETSPTYENSPLYQRPIHGINIKVAFGDSDRSANRQDNLNRTDSDNKSDYNEILLVDVTLSGMGASVDDSGRPVQEMYSFMGKRIESKTNIYR